MGRSRSRVRGGVPAMNDDRIRVAGVGFKGSSCDDDSEREKGGCARIGSRDALEFFVFARISSVLRDSVAMSLRGMRHSNLAAHSKLDGARRARNDQTVKC